MYAIRSYYEIRCRGKHLEPHLGQRDAGAFPRGDHLRARFLEPGVILPGGQRARQRQPAERVGVETVLDPAQCLDQIGLAEGKAHAQASKAARLSYNFV